MENRIDHIMNNFNFVRVRRAMEALDWAWANAANGIPSVSELRLQAEQLLQEVEKHQFVSFVEGRQEEYYFCECGGLRAEAINLGGGCRYLTLNFIVESWDTLGHISANNIDEAAGMNPSRASIHKLDNNTQELQFSLPL